MNLIIDLLTIVDIKSKEAKRIKFSNSKNFLTSKSNHLGKSLIMKSIYYSLGADVFYPATIDTKNLITYIDFHIQSKNFRVARYSRYFVLYQNEILVDKYDSVGKFGNKIRDIFKFDIELVSKNKGEEIVKCPPVFYYLPYYIDQENGWSNNSNSFNSLSQFDKNQREESYFFHFGVYDKDYVSASKDNKFSNKRIEELKKQNEKLETVIETLSNGLDQILYSFDEETLEISIESRKGEINELLALIEKTRNQIVMEEDYKLKCQQEKEIITKYLKKNIPKTEPSYNESVECPHCGYFFSSSIAEKVRNEYLKESINSDLLILIENVKKCEARISRQEEKFISYENQLKNIENSLMETQEIYDSYLKSKVTSKMIKEYGSQSAENTREITELKNKQKDLNKVLNKYKKRRNEVVKEYEETFFDLSGILDIPKSQIHGKVEPGKAILISGAYGPRCKISQMLAFAKTQKRHQPNIISFPFVIDSPNSVEQDHFHIETILETLLNWNETSNQVIISSIEGIDIAKAIDNVNIIELDNEKNHLLSNSCYNELENEINIILTNFI